VSFYSTCFTLQIFEKHFSEVYYQGKNAAKNENTKKNGCAVDLLTKHSNMIKFKAVVRDKGPIVQCATDCDPARTFVDGIIDNLLVHSSHNLI